VAELGVDDRVVEHRLVGGWCQGQRPLALVVRGGGRVISPSAAMRARATLADIALGRPRASAQPRASQAARAMAARLGWAAHSEAINASSASENSRPQ
jgi:hypothetical protein